MALRLKNKYFEKSYKKDYEKQSQKSYNRKR